MKTLITLALLALSFSVSAQTVTGMKRNPDGTYITTYSDGVQVVTKGRSERPVHPNNTPEKVAARHQAALEEAYARNDAIDAQIAKDNSITGKRFFMQALIGAVDHANYRQAVRTEVNEIYREVERDGRDGIYDGE
jgi:hypothetical protein